MSPVTKRRGDRKHHYESIWKVSTKENREKFGSPEKSAPFAVLGGSRQGKRTETKKTRGLFHEKRFIQNGEGKVMPGGSWQMGFSWVWGIVGRRL